MTSRSFPPWNKFPPGSSWLCFSQRRTNQDVRRLPLSRLTSSPPPAPGPQQLTPNIYSARKQSPPATSAMSVCLSASQRPEDSEAATGAACRVRRVPLAHAHTLTSHPHAHASLCNTCGTHTRYSTGAGLLSIVYSESCSGSERSSPLSRVHLASTWRHGDCV